MRINELISNLQEKQKKYGDVLVFSQNHPDQQRSYNSITMIDLIDCDIVEKNGKQRLERTTSILLK